MLSRAVVGWSSTFTVLEVVEPSIVPKQFPISTDGKAETIVGMRLAYLSSFLYEPGYG